MTRSARPSSSDAPTAATCQWALDLEAALRNVIDYLEGSDLSADHMKAKQLRDVLEGDSLV